MQVGGCRGRPKTTTSSAASVTGVVEDEVDPVDSDLLGNRTRQGGNGRQDGTESVLG